MLEIYLKLVDLKRVQNTLHLAAYCKCMFHHHFAVEEEEAVKCLFAEEEEKSVFRSEQKHPLLIIFTLENCSI